MQLRIKELREGKGWNQTVLAYHSGLSPSQISLIETGKRNPSATTLKGIADALGVEVGDLFPKADAPSSPPKEVLEERRIVFDTAAQMLEEINGRFGEYLLSLPEKPTPHVLSLIRE